MQSVGTIKAIFYGMACTMLLGVFLPSLFIETATGSSIAHAFDLAMSRTGNAILKPLQGDFSDKTGWALLLFGAILGVFLHFVREEA